jgi:transglutaminase-like putative cysteine protease
MMRIKLKHEAGFRYSGTVHASYNEARLLPADHTGQLVLSSRLAIRPRASQYSYVDYFGTLVNAFEVLVSHADLTVEASCLVETTRGQPEPVASAAWSEFPQLTQATTQLIEYAQQTRRTRPPAEVLDLARDLKGQAAHPSAAAEAVCLAIRDEVDYVQGVTGVNSTAAESWAEHRGVCQDITHIALGALRGIGVPARYVSGYLHPDSDPQLGQTVSGESHAWIEYFCGQWVGFDPTNRVGIGDRHILVARGRDYDDIAPIRGVYAGAGSSQMFVKVQLTRVA